MMRKVILEVGEVGENLVILDDVWESHENYTILGEKRLNSRWLNCIVPCFVHGSEEDPPENWADASKD